MTDVMYHTVISGSCLRNRGYVSNRDVIYNMERWSQLCSFYVIILSIMNECYMKSQSIWHPPKHTHTHTHTDTHTHTHTVYSVSHHDDNQTSIAEFRPGTDKHCTSKTRTAV